MADLSPIRVYVGDDWLVQVALVDTAGNPISLAGATVGVNFWTNNLLPPVDLAAAGGGVSVVTVNPGVVLLTVPRSVTAGLAQQTVLQKFYPTRAQVYLVDSLNHEQTVQLVPFQPIMARDTDLPSAAAVIGTVTAVLSPQGLAGPSQTINGKSGLSITLSAGDVGAYTKAEVDQAITAAVRAQFGADFMLWFAALPTACPSLPGQPWNNGGTFAVS